MMKELEYQKKAVKELVEKTMELLSESGDRKKIVFKAPTGSGKTVMMSKAIGEINSVMAEGTDSSTSPIAFIWIAPNKLHEQSYHKIDGFFSETRELHPIKPDELDNSVNGKIKAGEILFVNWESINKDTAVIMRETELTSSLYEVVRRTKKDGITIITIIDEEHLFVGKNIGTQSERVLNNINPKLEIRISATPTTDSDYKVTVSREAVIREEMIKRGIVLNLALEFDSSTAGLNRLLMKAALDKRNELAETYKKLGVDINPLLLIQLPNDNSATMSEEDNSIRQEVEAFLEEKEIKIGNNRLAIWLSGEKPNLEDVENPTSIVDVLLFKQAIAMGWDCPRAAVLLIFRENKDVTFTAQTVGRILRMPEQKFYVEDCLNEGYVYTNLSKDVIEIVKEDMDYMSSLSAGRRENLTNVILSSEYCERLGADRNRLGSDFRKYIVSEAVKQIGGESKIRPVIFSYEEQDGKIVGHTLEDPERVRWNNKKVVEDSLELNVDNLGIGIATDVKITGEVGVTAVENKKTHKYNKEELNLLFTKTCEKWIGGKYEKVSVSTLVCALKEAIGSIIDADEEKAVKIILCEKNLPKFDNIVANALNAYSEELARRREERTEKSFRSYNWEIPLTRVYNGGSHQKREDVTKHALLPYIELTNSSDPEKHFSDFLEKNGDHIDWWYKNGDAGKQHFAISYVNTHGVRSLFYVDFIVRMKSGQVFLFDTKSKESDPDAPAKHNALLDYINCDENKDKELCGGILIEDGMNWKYSTSKINDTSDLTNWKCFYPQDYR